MFRYIPVCIVGCEGDVCVFFCGTMKSSLGREVWVPLFVKVLVRMFEQLGAFSSLGRKRKGH